MWGETGGKKVGVRFDQNALYACMEFLIKMQKTVYTTQCNLRIQHNSSNIKEFSTKLQKKNHKTCMELLECSILIKKYKSKDIKLSLIKM